jgi:hypothetical protein
MTTRQQVGLTKRRALTSWAVLLGGALLVRVVGAWTDYPWCWYPDRDVIVHARNCINPHAPKLNPGEFIYPTGYIYLNALVYAATGAVAVAIGAVDGLKGLAELYYERIGFLAVVTRVLGSLLSCAAIWIVWHVAGELKGTLAAWLAATTLAFAWLDVVCCHYPTTDVAAAFALMAGCAWALRLTRANRVAIRDCVIGGLIAGAATAIKYPAGASLVGMMLAVGLGRRVGGERQEAQKGASMAAESAHRQDARDVAPTLAALGTVLLCALAGFLVLCPWVVLDWPTFAADMVYQGVYNHSGPDAPWQVHRFFFTMTPAAGLGWPLNLFALGGLIWLAVRRRREAAVLLLPPAVVYLSFAATTRFVPHWYEMVMPFVSLGAGLGVAWSVEKLMGTRRAVWVGGVLLAVMLAKPIAYEVWYDWLLLRPGSRDTMSAWVAKNIPKGGRVALTQWLWAGPDVPGSYYDVEWVLPASPERLYTGLRLKMLLDGVAGRVMKRFSPHGYEVLRQRQEGYLKMGESVSSLLPRLPVDAEWVIVNREYLRRSVEGAPRAIEPVPGKSFPAFGPILARYYAELDRFLTRHYRVAAVAGNALDQHPWSLWPYGSPLIVLYQRNEERGLSTKEINSRSRSSK